MNIKNLHGMGPPKKIEKQSVQEVRQNRGLQKENSTVAAATAPKTDQVEISDLARELQNSQDEQGKAIELLNRLPSARAHVVYEALAKVKAGFYSSDEIVEQAARKLLEGGELDDLI